MRVRATLLPVCLIAASLIGSMAIADYGTPPPPPPTSTPPRDSSPTPTDGSLPTLRQQAEAQFSGAYDDVVKAGKDIEKGKKNNADKKYRRALERCQEAVELDSTYHEAWNLIGFTSRKLGDYPHSFAAYEVALRLKPDFALAHEYYGEGLLETGNVTGAKLHLEALRRIGATEQIAALEGAITKYDAAHPESAVAASPPASGSTTAAGSARPDSTASSGNAK